MRFYSSIWLSTGLSYLDRAAAFVCPLLVLKGLGRADAYVSIEFVLSLGIIFATFFDAGLRNYLLFYTREAGSTKDALSNTVNAFKPLLCLHILGLVVAFAAGWQGGGSALQLIGLAIARASALTVTGLFVQGLIVVGKPALAPIASIANWCFSCIALALPLAVSELVLTTAFFSGSFAIVLGMACYAVCTNDSGLINQSARKHLGRSLRWGWPLLVSAAASMIVGNFSKVYAFSNLPAQDVLAFTFWMRAYSIVQLSHVAIVSILIGQIYKAEQPGILLGNLARYVKFILPPGLIIGLIGVFGSVWIPSVPFLGKPAAVVLFAYFCVWCLGAYLEIYLSKNAQNFVILKASLASSTIYVLGIFFIRPSSAFDLSALMAASAFVYAVLIIKSLGWRK